MNLFINLAMFSLLLIVPACNNSNNSHITLHSSTTDAFVCPDGAVCATTPDGGCDPNAQPSTCPAGQVCTSTGSCGVPCGNGNTVCDPTTICDSTSDCVPPCRNPDGSVVILDPLTTGQTCASAGYLTPADPNASCILPCWEVLCTSARHGYGGGCF